MESSEDPDPPAASRRQTAEQMAPAALATGSRLIHRQRRISAEWGELEDFLEHIPAALAPCPFTVCLVSDRSIRQYNRRFRKKAEATDVLSFPMNSQENEQEPYLGDILISVETAQRNAARYGLRVEEEMKVLVVHGLLHLRGMDHERDNGRMARQERRWAARLGLSQSLLRRNQSSQETSRCPTIDGSRRLSRQRSM